MRRIVWISPFVLVTSLQLTGCTTLSTPVSPGSPIVPVTSPPPPTPVPPQATTPTAKYLYSVNNDANSSASIQTYLIPTASGTVSPISSTPLMPKAVITALRFDGISKLYALSIAGPIPFAGGSGPATVHVYAVANGILTEERTFTYACQGGCVNVTADANGNVYLTDTGVIPSASNDLLLQFSPTASGSAKPVQTVSLGLDQNLGPMVVDSDGNLYGKQPNTPDVLEFPVGFTSIEQSAKLAVPSFGIFDIAIDPSKQLFALGYLGQVVNANASYGVWQYESMSATSPSRYIDLDDEAVSNTTGINPGSVAADSAGAIYVADFDHQESTATRRFLIFGGTVPDSGSISATDIPVVKTPLITLTSTVPANYIAEGGVAVQ